MFYPLTDQGIDVYFTFLPDIEESQVGLLLNLLDDQEIVWYNRIRHHRGKMQLLFSRVLVKRILSANLDIPPEDLCFKRNRHGKPYILEKFGESNKRYLQFNLSHSGYIAACAVVWNYEIGIDIQRIGGNIERVAEAFFNEQEKKHIKMYPEEERNNIAYRIWTMKEAFLKAEGIGITRPLNSFNVLESDMFLTSFMPLKDYYLTVVVKRDNKESFKVRLAEIYPEELIKNGFCKY